MRDIIKQYELELLDAYKHGLELDFGQVAQPVKLYGDLVIINGDNVNSRVISNSYVFNRQSAIRYVILNNKLYIHANVDFREHPHSTDWIPYYTYKYVRDINPLEYIIGVDITGDNDIVVYKNLDVDTEQLDIDSLDITTKVKNKLMDIA